MLKQIPVLVFFTSSLLVAAERVTWVEPVTTTHIDIESSRGPVRVQHVVGRVALPKTDWYGQFALIRAYFDPGTGFYLWAPSYSATKDFEPKPDRHPPMALSSRGFVMVDFFRRVVLRSSRKARSVPEMQAAILASLSEAPFAFRDMPAPLNVLPRDGSSRSVPASRYKDQWEMIVLPLGPPNVWTRKALPGGGPEMDYLGPREDGSPAFPPEFLNDPNNLSAGGRPGFVVESISWDGDAWRLRCRGDNLQRAWARYSDDQFTLLSVEMIREERKP